MSEEVEEECCWGDGTCNTCGKHFTYHYGTRKVVYCEWLMGDEWGCGAILVPSEKPPPNHVAARHAALTFYGLAKFRRRESPLLDRMGKDVAKMVARFVWNTRNDACWTSKTAVVARFTAPKEYMVLCGKCKEIVSVPTNQKRWPFGRVSCSKCKTVIRSKRGSDFNNPQIRKFIQDHVNIDPDENYVEVFDDHLEDGWE